MTINHNPAPQKVISGQPQIFLLPRNPADDHIPDSILNIYLAPGKIVTIQGPIFSKSMELLAETIALWNRMQVSKSEPDYQI